MTVVSSAVVTVATRSHFHRGSCLLESVNRYLPEADLYVVLADRDDGQLRAQPFEVIPVETLRIPNVAGFVHRYGPAELSFATKPWALDEMFRRGYDRVIYLDADIVVYSSLRPMVAMLDSASILLTPHLSQVPGDVASASEIAILSSFIFRDCCPNSSRPDSNPIPMLLRLRPTSGCWLRTMRRRSSATARKTAHACRLPLRTLRLAHVPRWATGSRLRRGTWCTP